MNKIVLILLFLIVQHAHAQTSSPNSVKPSANTKKIGTNTINSISYSLKHDTCLNKEFSVVFYVILDSMANVGLATPANLNQMLDTINDRFKRICVKFVSCSTVYIPVYPYSLWHRVNTEPLVTAQWYTDKTINMYLVDSIYNNFPNEASGYTYSTVPTASVPRKDLIVLEKFNIIGGNASAVPIHLLGHYFGLPHTHDEINPSPPATPPPPPSVLSHEFVNGSNCSSHVSSVPHGDGFCDTEADPGPNFSVIFDGMGQRYIRPIDNYMSFYSTRCRFTHEQYNRMAYKILTQRLYLH